jgi:putative transposase
MTVDMKPLPTELVDALLADYKKPEDLIGQNGLLKQITKVLVERALQAECPLYSPLRDLCHRHWRPHRA